MMKSVVHNTIDDLPLTTREAAAFLGLSPKTLEAWRLKQGEGPVFLRYGSRAVRYLVEDLRRWRAEHAIPQQTKGV
jgi:hypothetical protein